MSPTPVYLNLSEIIIVALGGIVGALAKDTIQDGALQLPLVKDGKLFLGCLGGAFVGAFIGLMIDGNFVTAALAGYTGSSVLNKLLDTTGTYSRTVNKPTKIEISKILGGIKIKDERNEEEDQKLA